MTPHPPPSVEVDRDESAEDLTVEDAIDDALEMTFPASDPPAWGCLARRRSEPDEP